MLLLFFGTSSVTSSSSPSLLSGWILFTQGRISSPGVSCDPVGVDSVGCMVERSELVLGSTYFSSSCVDK